MKWLQEAIASVNARWAVSRFEDAYRRTALFGSEDPVRTKALESCFSDHILPLVSPHSMHSLDRWSELHDQKISEAMMPMLAQMMQGAARRGDLARAFKCVEIGMGYTQRQRMLNSNVMLGSVYCAALPVSMNPDVRDKNPTIDRDYLQGLTRIFKSNTLPAATKGVMQLVLLESIAECERYSLWPNPFVKPHVLMVSNIQ